MTYDEFFEYYIVDCRDNKPDYIRLGQHLFNYLCEVNTILAEEIRATEYDCFYNDHIIDKTLKYLKENWK